MLRAIYTVSSRLARMLPRGLLEFAVETPLRLSLRFPPSRRKVYANFRRILKSRGVEPDDGELSRLMEQAIRHLGRLSIAMLAREDDLEYAREKVDLEFLPLMDEALKEGHGVILTTSNLGLFNQAILAMFQRGLPVRIPVFHKSHYDHMPNGWVEHFLTLGSASRECLRTLKKNGIVLIPTMFGFLSHPKDEELFGVPARLSYAPVRLAAATGAPILPVFAVDEGERCRVSAEGLIRHPEGGWPEDTMSRLIRVQERFIARHPEQWEIFEDPWDLRGADHRDAILRVVLKFF
jgi:lauroyl/myristoyl acyltransferase